MLRGEYVLLKGNIVKESVMFMRYATDSFI